MEQPCLVSGLNRTSFYVLCVLGSEGSVSSSNCSFSISDKSQNMKVKYSNKSWEDSTEDCVENFTSYSIMDQEMWGALFTDFPNTIGQCVGSACLLPYGYHKRGLRMSALLLKSCRLHLCL